MKLNLCLHTTYDAITPYIKNRQSKKNHIDNFNRHSTEKIIDYI